MARRQEGQAERKGATVPRAPLQIPNMGRGLGVRRVETELELEMGREIEIWVLNWTGLTVPKKEAIP